MDRVKARNILREIDQHSVTVTAHSKEDRHFVILLEVSEVKLEHR